MKSEYISHETIYKRIRGDESGGLRNHYRHKLKYRHHVKVVWKTKVRNIPDRTSIRQAGRSRRQSFWRLGNGSYHREGTKECHTDLVRTLEKLPPYGKAALGKESGKCG